MPYIPNVFDNNYNIMLPENQKLLQKNIKNMTFGKNEIILDIGCGPGHLTSDLILRSFEPHMKHIVAVDIDKSMLSLAREKYSHPKIYYKELDFSRPVTEEVKKQLLLNDSTLNGFNKIVSFFCLQDIKNQGIVSKNIHTLLQPGGEALIFLVGKCTNSEMMLGLSKVMKWTKYIQNVEAHVPFYHFSENPAQELKNYLENAGLHVQYCTEEPDLYKCKTPQEVKDLLSSFDTCLEKIPPELREEYMRDAMEIVKEDCERCQYRQILLTALVRKPSE